MGSSVSGQLGEEMIVDQLLCCVSRVVGWERPERDGSVSAVTVLQVSYVSLHALCC